MKLSIKDLSLNALVGALYFVLVYVFQFMSFTEIQFRIAEALLVLLLFNPKLAPGLVLGNFLVGLFSPYGIIDALVGTIASIVAIVLMIIFKKRIYATLLFPAISNGLIVGIMISITSKTPYIYNIGTVFIGEFVVMYLVGLPLYYYIKNNDYIKELIS